MRSIEEIKNRINDLADSTDNTSDIVKIYLKIALDAPERVDPLIERYSLKVVKDGWELEEDRTILQTLLWAKG